MARGTAQGRRTWFALAVAPLAVGAAVGVGAQPAFAEQGEFVASGDESLTFVDVSGATVTCTASWSVAKLSDEFHPEPAASANLLIDEDPDCLQNNLEVHLRVRTASGDEQVVSSAGRNSALENVFVSPAGTVERAFFSAQFTNCRLTTPGGQSQSCVINVDYTAPK
jgi:hypothetical protein